MAFAACAVRIVFDKNADAQDRKAELWIEVAGYEKECVAVFVQASSGTSVDAEMNLALNTYMHEILTKDYLFADAYNAQEIDMTTKYADFLDKHLLSLGDVNVADGGYRRASQAAQRNPAYKSPVLKIPGGSPECAALPPAQSK